MDRRRKVELFEENRREYRFGVGTIQGVAKKLKTHRRMVRQALSSAIPPERKSPVGFVNLIWPLSIASFGPTLLVNQVLLWNRRRALWELWKALCAFQAAVGIRVLCGFPSVASVSTGLRFLSFLLLFSFFVPVPSFPQENSRQDRLGTTIAHSVDPHHPRFLSLPSPFATFFLFQRSAETVRLRARLDDVGLVGQPVQHRLT